MRVQLPWVGVVVVPAWVAGARAPELVQRVAAAAGPDGLDFSEFSAAIAQNLPQLLEI